MQYKRCGLRNGAKEFCLMMPRTCPTAGQERTKSTRKAKVLADTWWTKGKADTWQTRFGGAAKVDTKPDTGRDMADKVWRRGQTGLKADTWPTHAGHMADKAQRCGQSRLKANTWRTYGNTRRAQGGHMPNKVWRRGHHGLKTDTRLTQVGHMADT